MENSFIYCGRKKKQTNKLQVHPFKPTIYFIYLFAEIIIIFVLQITGSVHVIMHNTHEHTRTHSVSREIVHGRVNVGKQLY